MNSKANGVIVTDAAAQSCMPNKAISAIVRDVVEKSGRPHKTIATEIGMSASSFSQRLANNTFTAEEFKRAVEAAGYQLVLQPAALFQHRGIGERVRMMVDGIKYDTHAAVAICHTDQIDGWYMELYMDSERRFYVVHYTRWQSAKPFISPVSKEEAKALWEKYGGSKAYAELFD